MDTRLVLILLGLLAAGGALADAYTWTDENGIVHYSDRPQPGARQIELPESRPARPRPTAPRASSTAPQAAEDAAAPFSYESLVVSSPAAEETLWNIETIVYVTLSLSPSLRPGHQVRVHFDGTPHMVAGTSFQLRGVYRGAHNLQVEVIDEAGDLMIRSQPSRFYVQQNSIL